MTRKYEGVIWRKIKGKRTPFARVCWTDSAGRKRRTERQARTVSEARQHRIDIMRELENGPEVFEASKLTFRELAEKFAEKKLVEPSYVGDTRIKGQRSWKQQRVFLKPLVSHFGAFLVRKITYEHLVEYRQKRFELPTRTGSQRSVAMVNRELSLLRSIFTYAKRLNIVTRSPFDAGESLISIASEARRDRILTVDEEKKLLAQCVGPRAHLRYIVIAALDTGMRRGELLQLVWGDVDFERGIILIRSTTTKTMRPRTIGMTGRLTAALLEWLELTQARDKDFIFGGIRDCKTAFNTACRKAKITDLHFHDLRHTATTRLVQSGASPSITMKITGHTQFATFARYVNPDHNAAREAASYLDNFNQKGESRGGSGKQENQ